MIKKRKKLQGFEKDKEYIQSVKATKKWIRNSRKEKNEIYFGPYERSNDHDGLDY